MANLIKIHLEEKSPRKKAKSDAFSNAKLGLGRVEARIGDSLRPHWPWPSSASVLRNAEGGKTVAVTATALNDTAMSPHTNGKQHIPYDVPVICIAGEFGNQLEAGGIKSGLHGTLPATHERTTGQ
ncbi:hypothetical protein N7481_013040 [Penicillium waksmanii]|uniref:uncharacterized protein n=1 Tax=Penicillium waksmanii TaxID=69791 RepID=UPI002548F6F3|nr:uncharacterized protein N7481_013040 [Penicillium waksmanii]KAJ5966326.1 hypothetical protein N7481_013040 [Penicillium waksmanii]